MSTLIRVALLGCALAAVPANAAEWTPSAWVDEDTVELRTTAPGEEPYWFKVWLVVIDDQVYVRLGSRAANRIEENQTAPVIGVRLAGQEFDRVKGVPAPEKAEAVAEAIGDKYWSDIFIRLVPHPLTLRLEPE